MRPTLVVAAGLLALSPAMAPAQQARLAPPEERPAQVVAAPERTFPDARASTLTHFEEVGLEFYVHAALNDFVLQNDLSRLTFGGLGGDETARRDRSGNILLRFGGLLDITTRPATEDRFHLFTPSVDGINQVHLYNTGMELSEEPNGAVSLTVTARDDRFHDLEVVTEYIMYRDVPGVLASTTMTNRSDSQTSPEVAASDIILWGALSPFIPGRGYVGIDRFRIEGAEFIFGARDDMYVLIAPETGTFDIIQGGEGSGLYYGESLPMEPGETRIYRRWILVSELDPASLFSVVLQRREGAAPGILAGRVIERELAADGQMLDVGPVPDTMIQITPLLRPDFSETQRTNNLNRPYIFARTRPRGEFDTFLPEGSYRLVPAPSARLAPAPNVAARIRPGEIEAFDFGTSRASRLLYQIIDAETKERIPGKLTFEPLRGTEPPYFGNPGEVRSHNVIFSSHGSGVVEVPPGNYRVIASRGPEYDITEHRIRIRETADHTQVFELQRAFETPGWISADIGVRTNATPISKVTPEARVASAVAEGVDWIVTGDPFTATNLQPVIEEVGLANRIKASPGYRYSGATAPFLGDFLLFPTTACGDGELDFSLAREAQTADEVIEALRALCPEAVLMLSRPTWPFNGYLTLQGYNAERGGELPRGEFSLDFDAVQIWEGKRQGVINQDYQVFHRILRTGQRMTALAGTNSHGTFNAEVGYPRVYIRSTARDVASIDPEELARSIKQGQVSITNGPFIQLTANGEPMGSQITDTSGSIELNLEVYAPNWVTVSAININVNGRFVRRLLVSAPEDRPSGGRVFPSEGRPGDGRFTIRVTEDSLVDVMVEGTLTNTMDPVNPFHPMTRERVPAGQFPVALSAPIFVDADGDGRVDLEVLPTVDLLQFEEEATDPTF